MANIKLQLKAKHFEGTFFCLGECAIEKAYKEKTGNSCSEGVCHIDDISMDKHFKHEMYSMMMFKSDKLKAETHNWDDTVIRTIELIEG